MDWKLPASRTQVLVGVLILVGVAIAIAAAMGAFDPTRRSSFDTLEEARESWVGRFGFIPDVAPAKTADVVVAYDVLTRQYVFAGAVSPAGMAQVQEAVTLRGYEPTGALAPTVDRLDGIDPFGAAQRDAIDLRYVRVTTASVEFTAIDSDGQRYYVTRMKKDR